MSAPISKDGWTDVEGLTYDDRQAITAIGDAGPVGWSGSVAALHAVMGGLIARGLVESLGEGKYVLKASGLKTLERIRRERAGVELAMIRRVTGQEPTSTAVATRAQRDAARKALEAHYGNATKPDALALLESITGRDKVMVMSLSGDECERVVKSLAEKKAA